MKDKSEPTDKLQKIEARLIGSGESTIHASSIRLAGVLPAYTRREGIEWDWVAEMPLYIPPGHRIIAEVSKEGVFSMRREKL